MQVEASQGARRKYFGSGIYILPKEWDGRRRMIVGHPNAEALNAYLFEMVINLERIELDLWKRGVAPTLSLIKEAVSGPGEPEVSFLTFCEESVRQSSRRISTKKNLMSTVKCLSRFKGRFGWEEVDRPFVQGFEVWLCGEGFAKNTVIKHLRNLRTFVNDAIVAGYIQYEDNPFRSFRIASHKTPHRFLSPEELERMEKVSAEGRLAHTRDAFLFCCYTGLRFSDFCLIRQEFLSTDRGCIWLRMRLKKTGVEVSIPLSLLFDGKGVDLLRRYDSVASFARVGSNSRVNGDLKVLQKMAGIRTCLTFHVSRHTCATLLCYQGVPITTVQKILGHTKVSTTQLYQEVMAETMVKDLMRVRRL